MSALSVIAAAKAGARGGVSTATEALPAVRPAAEVESTDRPSRADQATVGELHVHSAQQDAERRARRRRRTVFAGLAAACAVGVAAIVIPLALSNSTSTTSAGGAADTSADTSAARAQTQAGAPAAAAPSAQSQAPDQQEASDQDQGAAGASPPATIDPSNPDANRPPPGEDALTETVPVPGGTAPTDGSGAGGVAASCWPALSDASNAALVASLPAGAFGPPGLLGLGCPADPVAGASLAGTAPDTQLVVRVVRAEPGACAQSASETGARCVARGADQYVSNDSGNLSVYAYGNGYEVEVGGRPATGIAPIPSGLSADQLAAAAAAVLATLG